MSYCQQTSDGVLLHLRIQPGASRSEIAEIRENTLRIRLQSPALENRANQELIRFLAKQLGIKKAQIVLISGEKSRDKVVLVTGLDHDMLMTTLKKKP